MAKVITVKKRGKSGKRSAKARSKKLKLLSREKLFVGVDVHKRTYSVAIWSSERGLLTTWTQPSIDELVIEKLKPMAKQISEVVYEAGPTGYKLVRAMREAKLNAQVIAPSETPEKKGRRSKDDKRDCRRLAEYACKDLLKRIYVPTLQEEADRQVTRVREAMRKKLQRTKCQIKSFLLLNGICEPDGVSGFARRGIKALRDLELNDELRFVLDRLMDDYEHHYTQMKKCFVKVKGLAASDRHSEAVEHMRSVTGVGLITAVTMRTELPNPERFDRPEEVTAMIGFVPQRIRSGDQEFDGPIEKMGNSHLRAALVEAAWRWMSYDDAARERYYRLLKNTGNGKKAIVGVARKLGMLLWILETRREDYKVAA
jgi:transposase